MSFKNFSISAAHSEMTNSLEWISYLSCFKEYRFDLKWSRQYLDILNSLEEPESHIYIGTCILLTLEFLESPYHESQN